MGGRCERFFQLAPRAPLVARFGQQQAVVIADFGRVGRQRSRLLQQRQGPGQFTLFKINPAQRIHHGRIVGRQRMGALRQRQALALAGALVTPGQVVERCQIVGRVLEHQFQLGDGGFRVIAHQLAAGVVQARGHVARMAAQPADNAGVGLGHAALLDERAIHLDQQRAAGRQAERLFVSLVGARVLALGRIHVALELESGCAVGMAFLERHRQRQRFAEAAVAA